MPDNDNRAEFVAALRELAVLIERDHDRPLPFCVDAVRHLVGGEQELLDATVRSLGGAELRRGSERPDREPIDRYTLSIGEGLVTYGVQWERGTLTEPAAVPA